MHHPPNTSLYFSSLPGRGREFISPFFQCSRSPQRGSVWYLEGSRSERARIGVRAARSAGLAGRQRRLCTAAGEMGLTRTRHDSRQKKKQKKYSSCQPSHHPNLLNSRTRCWESAAGRNWKFRDSEERRGQAWLCSLLCHWVYTVAAWFVYFITASWEANPPTPSTLPPLSLLSILGRSGYLPTESSYLEGGKMDSKHTPTHTHTHWDPRKSRSAVWKCPPQPMRCLGTRLPIYPGQQTFGQNVLEQPRMAAEVLVLFTFLLQHLGG